MEIKNTPIPAQTQTFTGIRINASEMTDAQAKLSRRISDMLDYTDEYVKTRDTVDVYMLPGKSEKSIVVKFMDKLSDMFYQRGKTHAQTNINPDKNNFDTSVDDICKNLNKIETGKYKAPELDINKVLKGETDFAKVDPETHEQFAENFDNLKEYEELFGKANAQEEMVDTYSRIKRNTLSSPDYDYSEF